MIATRMGWLVGLCLFLGVLLGAIWLWPAEGPPPPGPPARFRAANRSVTLAARETGSWAGVILARPVFSISRRPPKVVAGGRAETAPGQARLSGIMITRLGRRAIFAPDGGGHAMVLAERAQVNQGTIRSILPDRVVMADGTVLRPSYDRNRAPGVNTTLPYQPPVAFNPQPNPIFNGPGGGPGANFQNPGMLGNPAFAQPGTPFGFQPPANPAEATGDGQPQPPMPPPAFRGTMIPPRRE